MTLQPKNLKLGTIAFILEDSCFIYLTLLKIKAYSAATLQAKMIVKIFKRILGLWLFDEVQRFIKQMALSSCRDCKDNKPLDINHDCYRIRSGLVHYEVSDVHFHFRQAFALATDMLELQSCLPMITRMLKNELLKEGFSQDDMLPLLTKENIRKFSNSKESAEWILHKLYINLNEFGNDFDDELVMSVDEQDNDQQNDINDQGDNNGSNNENDESDDQSDDDDDYDEMEILMSDQDDENDNNGQNNEQTHDNNEHDECENLIAVRMSSAAA